MALQYWKVTVRAVRILPTTHSERLRAMGLLEPLTASYGQVPPSRNFYCNMSVAAATPAMEVKNLGPLGVVMETQQHQIRQLPTVEVDFVLARQPPVATPYGSAMQSSSVMPKESFEFRFEFSSGPYVASSSSRLGSLISRVSQSVNPNQIQVLGAFGLELSQVNSGEYWFQIRGPLDPSTPFAEVLIEFSKDPEEVQFLAQSFQQFAQRYSTMVPAPQQPYPPPPPPLSLYQSEGPPPPPPPLRNSVLLGSTSMMQASLPPMARTVAAPVGSQSLPTQGSQNLVVSFLDMPVIVFVNGKSGGKQGKVLISEFEKLLPKEQVFDILNGGPLAGLMKYRFVPNLRVLACGGDGTGRWVLETLDKIKADLGPTFRQPPVGILPLGTGNDIGRVLGWGGGYNNEPLKPILDDLIRAVEVPLDRWIVEIEEEGGRSFNSTSDGPTTAVMNNYLCLGFADAKIALNFHQRREQSPDLFFNRNVNKLWYVNYGVREILKDSTVGGQYLSNYMAIEVDGRPVSLPQDCEGIVVLNLPSYAGGMNLWGPKEEPGYTTVSMSDFRLEVIGLRSVFHLGQIGAGLVEGGVRIAQGCSLRIHFLPNSPPMPGKIDGEPWLQANAARFHIRHLTQSRMLCKLDSPGCLVAPQLCGWMYNRRRVRWKLRWVVLHSGYLWVYLTRTDQTFRERVNMSGAKVQLTNRLRAQECFGITEPCTGKSLTFSVQDTGASLGDWLLNLQRAGAVYVD